MTVKNDPGSLPKVQQGQTAPATAAPTEEAMKQVMVATRQELKKAKDTLDKREGFEFVDEAEAEQTEAALSDKIDKQVPGYAERLFGWLRQRIGS